MPPRLVALWRDHSKTIVGLALGSTICVAARLYWASGGPDFDIVTLVGGVLLSFGIQGIIDANFREIAKPEDDPCGPENGGPSI